MPRFANARQVSPLPASLTLALALAMAASLPCWGRRCHAEDSVKPATAADSAAETDPEIAAETDEDGSSETPAGHSYHGEAFNQGPRQAAVLLPGMGNIDFASSAHGEQTQAFVNQGIAALHGFWYLEAERSFRQAAMLEPGLAIAYWGMAQANTNNAGRARDFVDKAVELREAATRREQLYIDSLATFLKKPEKRENGEQKKKREQKYIDDLETIVNEFPDDLDARALLGLRLWHARRDIPIASNLAVNALFSEVFAVNPLHPAHHYRIHLWDGPRPSNALASSAMCGPALPGVAHMWHMPGHIYSKLHRYGDAAWHQEASARVDHSHMVRARLMPDQIHNFAHNNEWLVRNLIFLGRVDEALAQSRNLIAMPQHPEYNTISKRGSFRHGRTRLLQTLTSYELWERLLVESETPRLEPTADERLRDERLAWVIVAKYLTGDAEGAKAASRDFHRRRLALESEILDLEEGLETVAAEDRDKDERTGKLKQSRSKLKTLQAWLAKGEAAAAVAAKDAEAASDAIRRAGDIEDVLAASWIGQAGDHQTAIERLEKLVPARPGQIRPLALLVDQLWQAGRHDEAVKRFESLRGLAGSADLDTPLLARLTPVVEKAAAPTDWRLPAEPANDIGERPELDVLGPRFWSSYTAENWQARNADDVPISDDLYQGRARLVIFYLGFGCLHCVEQLTAIKPRVDDFVAAGIDVLAISTEDVDQLRKGVAAYGSELPIEIVADPDQQIFKRYRCWDDFESQPLHGTFLIAPEGTVRWQDIGHEPFNQVDFLLEESKRLLATPLIEPSE